MADILDKHMMHDIGRDSRKVNLGKALLSALPPAVKKQWNALDYQDKLDVLRRIKQVIQAARDADPIGDWLDKLTKDQKAFVFEEAPEKICSGGNKAGKTAIGVLIDVIIFTGKYPKGWPDRYAFDPEQPRFIWACSVDRMIQVEPGGIQDTILSMLPPGSIKRIVKVAGSPEAIMFIEGWDGSRIVFKAYGAGAEVFQTAGIHHLHYDEEPQEIVYFEGQQRGIVTKGTAIITMTPWKGITWVHARLVKPGYVPVHYIKTADNPVVDRTEQTRRERTFTKVEKMVRSLGLFMPIVGYPRFDIESFSEALETAKNPAKWLDLRMDPDAPDDPKKYIVSEATEAAYRPLALYVDPRGRKGWSNRWVMGVDTSEGFAESTECSAVVWDRYLKCVAAVWHGLWDPELWMKMVGWLGHFYNNAYICPEVNNQGIIVVRYLVRHYGALYVRERGQTTTGEVSEQFGWFMSNASKSRMEGHCIHVFNDIGRGGEYDLSYGPLISQGMTYQRTPAGTGKCAPGTLDDMLIACMLAQMMDLQAPAMLSAEGKKQREEKERTRKLRQRSSRKHKKTSWMSH